MKDSVANKIGGFQGLELPFCVPEGVSVWDHITHGACQLIEQANARCVFASIIGAAKPATIWYPAYLCPAMILEQFCSRSRFYPVGCALSPDIAWLDERVKKGDAVVAINFFGAPPDDAFRRFVTARPDLLWLEDCAQALAPGKHWGDWVIYSPRKLFGVADGGLGVCRTSDKKLQLPSKEGALDFEALLGRLGPALWRYEDQSERFNDIWYQQFLDVERLWFANETEQTAGSLSRLTREILQAIEVEAIIAKRKRNAIQLHEALPEAIRFWQTLPETPLLGYPVLLKDRDRVTIQLSEGGIFCPVHWRELPSAPGTFAAEHTLSQAILTLPCDQRYGPDDMLRITDALLAIV